MGGIPGPLGPTVALLRAGGPGAGGGSRCSQGQHRHARRFPYLSCAIERFARQGATNPARGTSGCGRPIVRPATTGGRRGDERRARSRGDPSPRDRRVSGRPAHPPCRPAAPVVGRVRAGVDPDWTGGRPDLWMRRVSGGGRAPVREHAQRRADRADPAPARARGPYPGTGMTRRDLLALLGLTALAATLAGVQMATGVAPDVLIAAPGLLLLLPLAAGRYVGEDGLVRFARAIPFRPRGAARAAGGPPGPVPGRAPRRPPDRAGARAPGPSRARRRPLKRGGRRAPAGLRRPAPKGPLIPRRGPPVPRAGARYVSQEDRSHDHSHAHQEGAARPGPPGARRARAGRGRPDRPAPPLHPPGRRARRRRRRRRHPRRRLELRRRERRVHELVGLVVRLRRGRAGLAVAAERHPAEGPHARRREGARPRARVRRPAVPVLPRLHARA